MKNKIDTICTKQRKPRQNTNFHKTITMSIYYKTSDLVPFQTSILHNLQNPFLQNTGFRGIWLEKQTYNFTEGYIQGQLLIIYYL